MRAWWRQRDTEEEKAAIKAGKRAAEIWPDKPAKAGHKDTDAAPSAACWPRLLRKSDRRPPGLRWADTAYRSKANEGFLSHRGKTSRIHRKKPAGKPMPKRTAKANARKKVRARVEHVFAQQKAQMKRTIRRVV